MRKLGGGGFGRMPGSFDDPIEPVPLAVRHGPVPVGACHPLLRRSGRVQHRRIDAFAAKGRHHARRVADISPQDLARLTALMLRINANLEAIG
jgi:hypothetical protein